MHIGGVFVFDPLPGGGTPSLEELQASVGLRLTQLPRYTQRLSSERTGGLSWPCWREDHRFDIRSHFHRAALPAPGGEKELCEWAGEFFSHRLDRTRPLWEMALIEGLPEGRWGLASKTHHALVDGVGSVGVVQLLLDAQPEPEPGTETIAFDGPDAPWEVRTPAGGGGLLSGAVGTITHTAGSALHAMIHPMEALERSRSLLKLILDNEVSASPRTTLNVPIGAMRRFTVVHADLSDLKAVGHELGASVNDVLLAACAGGVRELMLSRGERPPTVGVRAMVPMNLRADAERLALGNHISSLFVALPVSLQNSRERLASITESTRRLKAGNAALGAATMLDLAALAPPVLHSLIARSLYATRLFNITITNVPGPQIPLYTMGARLRDIYPLVPLAAEHSVGIAIFSYDGRVSIGISADRDSCPDLDVLVCGVSRELAELRGLVTTA